jgi:hypothetical protein
VLPELGKTPKNFNSLHTRRDGLFHLSVYSYFGT